MTASYKKLFLAGILLLAFVLRIWGVGDRDMIGDEATYSFRSIGYVDYLGTSFQTQPIDWYANEALPWWTSLSFHDAPPLDFAIHHAFFRMFGNSLFVARLPSVLFGTASVYFVYAIAGLLLPAMPLVPLFAALFFAISSASVGIFRTTLLEPTLLFFILLNVYCFLRYAGNKKWWWGFGATFGIALLTKYTALFFAPLYFVYLALRNRASFRDWRLYCAAVLALVIISPVILYNIALYQARGHFDLQFAYLFGQQTPEWQGLLGKIQAPFGDILHNLYAYYGALTLVLCALGLFVLLYRKELRRSNATLFVFLYLLFASLLLMKIGSANRFLVLYAPAFALLWGVAAWQLWSWFAPRWKYAAMILIAGIALLELGRSIKVNFYDVEDFGIAKLDHYLERVMEGKVSAVRPESDNMHLNEVIDTFAQRKGDGEPKLVLLIYNDNIALGTLEWIFYRRFFYENIPAMYVENFERVLVLQGPEYFKNFDLYFVASTPNTELNPFKTDKKVGEEFEAQFVRGGVKPEVIYGKNNQEMFRVYKFKM